MSILLWILLSILIVSSISLLGILALGCKDATLQKVLPYVITFSGGALLGDVFLHIIPEIAEDGFHTDISYTFLGGILIFFLLEKIFHWHRSHTHHDEEIHSRVIITQVGDTIHNFIDGMVIAGSFIVSVPLGIASTIAIILHEIPQEIGNYGILIHGGWSKGKALFYNFLTALTAFIGGLLIYFFNDAVTPYIPYLLAFTGANFLYLALSDIFPELNAEEDVKKILIHALFLLIGIAIMALLLGVEGLELFSEAH